MNIIIKRSVSVLVAFLLVVSFSFGTYVYAETPEEAQTESQPQTESEPTEEEIEVSNGDGYGTEFEGIYTTKINNYTKIPATESFYNGSFSQGLRYWARTGDGYTSALATLMDAGENRYIKLNITSDEEMLTTTKFKVLNENVYSGRSLVVVYDWLGDQNFDVELTQWDSTGALLISSGFGKSLYKAKSNDEWNTAATAPLNVLYHSDEGFYFTIKIRLLSTQPTEALIDNIRIALVSKSGILYDLEGNRIEGVSRKADVGETETVIVSTPKKEKSDGMPESSVIDTNTIIILCSVGGAALCVMAISVVLMVYNSKKTVKKPSAKKEKKQDEPTETEE